MLKDTNSLDGARFTKLIIKYAAKIWKSADTDVKKIAQNIWIGIWMGKPQR